MRWSPVLPFALLALVLPAAHARDLGAPLPPVAVQAERTAEGVLVSWMPPAYDGGLPVTSYTVYALAGDGVTWAAVGQTDGAASSYLVDLGAASLLYEVVASNGGGDSPPSEPALTFCDPVGVSVDFDFPFAHYVVNWACMPEASTLLWVH